MVFNVSSVIVSPALELYRVSMASTSRSVSEGKHET